MTKKILVVLACIVACGISVGGVNIFRCAGIACASVQYDPVCGSDGKTYHDSCDFILRTCATNPPVTIVHRGPCRGEGGLIG